jgi:hypothetical protein
MKRRVHHHIRVSRWSAIVFHSIHPKNQPGETIGTPVLISLSQVQTWL